MEWTDESITRLRSLWQEGLSTAEIGRRMQITKNAVVGKAHRLTLPPRPSPIRKVLELASTGLQTQEAVLEGNPATAGHVVRPAIPRQPVVPQPAAPQSVVQPADVSPVAARPVAAPVVPVPEPARVAVSPEPPAIINNVQALRPMASEPRADLRAEAGAAVQAAEPVDANPVPLRAMSAPRRRGLTCCWPIGEPGTKEFHFCGGDPAPGKPYCTQHAALAYVKLRDRRDSVA